MWQRLIIKLNKYFRFVVGRYYIYRNPIRIILVAILISMITISLPLFIIYEDQSNNERDYKTPRFEFIAAQSFPSQELEDFLLTGDTKSNQKLVDQTIKVSIVGAVNNPGVFELKSGSIINDLLIISEGLSPNADKLYLSQNINLAQTLEAGQQIYIPTSEELKLLGNIKQSSGDSVSSADLATDSLININTASISELQKLSGVGESTAAKIVSARPFNSVEDLLDVSGIGEATLAKFRDQVEI